MCVFYSYTVTIHVVDFQLEFIFNFSNFKLLIFSGACVSNATIHVKAYFSCECLQWENGPKKSYYAEEHMKNTIYTHEIIGTHSEISNDNVDSLRKKNCSHSVTLLSTATHTIIEWVITNRKYNLFYLLQREQQHVEHLMILSFQVVCDAILQRQTNQTHTLMTPFFSALASVWKTGW